MWSLIIVACALTSRTLARTTVLIPKTSLEVKSSNSPIYISASGSITDNDIAETTGTIEVRQAPFLAAISRSTEDIVSTQFGYSNDFNISLQNQTIEASVDANAQISSQSGTGSLSVSSSSFYGNPRASVQATLTKNGITEYEIGVNAGSTSDDVQVSAQLTGVPSEGVNVQSTVTIGPVVGTVTKNSSGWDEKVVTQLTVLTDPSIVLIGELHQDTNGSLDYTLGVDTPVAWGKVHINANDSIDYYFGGTANGTQDNVTYTIEANAAYFGDVGTTQYNVELTVGPVTGILQGTLYENYSLLLKVDLYIFVVSLNVDITGDPSYFFEINLTNATVILSLDNNFNPSTLTGEFWNNLLSMSAQTDFDGDYNMSVQLEDQNMTLSV